MSQDHQGYLSRLQRLIALAEEEYDLDGGPAIIDFLHDPVAEAILSENVPSNQTECRFEPVNIPEGYRKAIADEALRSADTPNPLGLNEDSAQYSGQSIQSAGVAPSGWRMVPTTATPEMIEAGKGWRETDPREGLKGEARMIEAAYYTMVRAAPNPPALPSATATTDDAAKWRIAMDLPYEINEAFFGGEFNPATLLNAVYAAMRAADSGSAKQ